MWYSVTNRACIMSGLIFGRQSVRTLNRTSTISTEKCVLLHANAKILPRLGNGDFLPDPSQVVRHQLPTHPSVCLPIDTAVRCSPPAYTGSPPIGGDSHTISTTLRVVRETATGNVLANVCSSHQKVKHARQFKARLFQCMCSDAEVTCVGNWLIQSWHVLWCWTNSASFSNTAIGVCMKWPQLNDNFDKKR
jgi:hypothetical protein